MSIKMNLVSAICDNSNFELNCRGLNNLELATQLLVACSVPFDAITDIPLSWSGQVAIVYKIGNVYHEFGCGASTLDGNYFEIDEIIND
jgi:hypothetical protein